jgi:hypothetical protein
MKKTRYLKMNIIFSAMWYAFCLLSVVYLLKEKIYSDSRIDSLEKKYSWLENEYFDIYKKFLVVNEEYTFELSADRKYEKEYQIYTQNGIIKRKDIFPIDPLMEERKDK